MDNLGISAVELQEEVKRVGDFGTAAGTIIRRELESMGDVADTTAIKISSLSTTFTNLKTALGEKLVGAGWFQDMLRGMEVVTGMLNKGSELSMEELTAQKEILEAQREQLILGNNSIKQELAKLSIWDKIIGRGTQLNKDAKANGKNLRDNEKELEKIYSLLSKITNIPAGPIEKLNSEIKDIAATVNKIDIISAFVMPDFITDIDMSEIDAIMTAIDEELSTVALAYTAAETAAMAFAEQVMASSASGANSLKDFARVAVSVAKQIIAAEIAKGVASAVEKALVTVPFPFNIVAASVAGGAAAALFNSIIPDFAAGGAVSGPTLAMVGEASGISKSNPEYIGTAAQIGQMGGRKSLTARVSRGDLLFILNEGESYNQRSY